MAIGDLYTCALCKDEFRKTTSEEEMVKEFEENFGPMENEDIVSLCDDCYDLFMKRAREEGLTLKHG